MINKFFELALIEKDKSCDPNTKVGCIIACDNEILSSGYNCLPKGLNEWDYPLNIREGQYLDTKYPYMIHSEAKAIVEAKKDLSNAQMYVTLFPCNECTKLIIQAGINHVYYLEDKYFDQDSVIAAKRMLDDAGIPYTQIDLY